MPVCDFCKHVYEGEHECDLANAKLSAVIGIVSHFMPLRQVVPLLTVSKAVGAQVDPILQRKLTPAREMWAYNHALEQPMGATRLNFINEGLVARLLRSLTDTYRPWDSLSNDAQTGLAKHFSVDKKPDYVMEVDGALQVGDCFSVNHPCPPNGIKTEAMSKRAIESSFPNKLLEKWDKYGPGSFAVAWLQGFPDGVSTDQILGWIATQCAEKFIAYRQKQNSLFLVRDPIIKRILI